MLLSSYRMVYFITHDVVRPVIFVNMYLSNVVMYASLYMAIFILDSSSLIFLASPPLGTNAVSASFGQKLDALVGFWYLSSTIMTTTGYGDILPISAATKIVALAQLLTNCMCV